MDEPWWRYESDHRHGIAYGLLYHVTGDPELAEQRAKAFTAEVLDPLAGGSSSIPIDAVEAWLMAPASRPAPVWKVSGDLAIQCARCPTLLPVAVRHFEILSVFGTLCQSCREVPA